MKYTEVSAIDNKMGSKRSNSNSTKNKHNEAKKTKKHKDSCKAMIFCSFKTIRKMSTNQSLTYAVSAIIVQ